MTSKSCGIFYRPVYFHSWLLLLFVAGYSEAVDPPSFRSARSLTNQEVVLDLSVPSGRTYRLDGSTNLIQWRPMTTFPGKSVYFYTDSIAPYFPMQFYRLEQYTNSIPFTGDFLSSTNGDIVIHPVNHASFVLSWNGYTIYNDPVGGAGAYSGLPKADLILVSHSHGDHFDSSTITSVRAANGWIVAPADVASSLGNALKPFIVRMANGAKTNVLGIQIEAVPAYNSFHPKGSGNGYVIQLSDRRFYMSGDTEDVAEMRALRNIDVAFLCMNLPFTMSVDKAASATRDFRPRIVYPYHYRNQAGTYSDLGDFKRRVGHDLGIEVRLRNWY